MGHTPLSCYHRLNQSYQAPAPPSLMAHYIALPSPTTQSSHWELSKSTSRMDHLSSFNTLELLNSILQMDLHTQAVLLQGPVKDGLYVLPIEVEPSTSTTSSPSSAVFLGKRTSSSTWHCRLEHHLAESLPTRSTSSTFQSRPNLHHLTAQHVLKLNHTFYHIVHHLPDLINHLNCYSWMYGALPVLLMIIRFVRASLTYLETWSTTNKMYK